MYPDNDSALQSILEGNGLPDSSSSNDDEGIQYIERGDNNKYWTSK